MKCDPIELARALKTRLSEIHWTRYYKSPSQNLPVLLRRDAEHLESKAKSALILDAKRHYRRQARNLESISEKLQKLQNCNTSMKIQNRSEEDQKILWREIDSFGQLVMRAARNGLRNHPFIKKYVEVQRLTLNYPLLRKSKIGLEAKLGRPIEYRQIIILALRRKGYTLEQISRRLVRLELNPEGKTLGRKGVHKRLRQSRNT